jgi:hypothetical protein
MGWVTYGSIIGGIGILLAVGERLFRRALSRRVVAPAGCLGRFLHQNHDELREPVLVVILVHCSKLPHQQVTNQMLVSFRSVLVVNHWCGLYFWQILQSTLSRWFSVRIGSYWIIGKMADDGCGSLLHPHRYWDCLQPSNWVVTKNSSHSPSCAKKTYDGSITWPSNSCKQSLLLPSGKLT